MQSQSLAVPPLFVCCDVAGALPLVAGYYMLGMCVLTLLQPLVLADHRTIFFLMLVQQRVIERTTECKMLDIS